MSRIFTLSADSLKNCMHADSIRIDSLSDIFKANTAVFDSNTANNKFAIDSLTDHIQICQNQIDSIYTHGDPFHYLSSVIPKLASNICDIFNMDIWNLVVTFFVTVCFLYMVIRCWVLKKNPDRYKEKKKEWDKRKKSKHPMWDMAKPWKECIFQLLKKVSAFFLTFPERIIFFHSDIKEYLRNQIKFDREILSENGFSLLRFSLYLAVLLPIVTILCCIPIGFLWQLFKGGEYSTAFGIYDETHTRETNILWAVISQYLDPGNLSNSNGFGSVIAFVLAAAGIVCLSGFLVSSIVNWVSQRRERWQKGLITYENVKDFNVVIIGINEQTASIARGALENDGKYVLIQTRQDVEKVRPELESKIDDDKQDRIVYYAGDRTSYEDIKKLHLENASEVYVLGENYDFFVNKKKDDEAIEKEHDAYNISCLEHISNYIKEERKNNLEKAKNNLEKAKNYRDEAKKSLEEAKKKGVKEKELKKCEAEYNRREAEYNKREKEYREVFNRSRLNVHVQFDYQSTFTAFKATHLYQKLGRDIRFIPFNIHELWAKKVLVDNLAIYPAGNKTELKVQRYYPIDTYVDKNDQDKRKGITDCEKTVHLVIIGMNQMGTALATQAALLCHFPNFATDKSKKTVITFIDDNAISEAEYYMGRYATLFELSHYRIVKLNGDEANSNEFNWKTTDPFITGKYNHLITKADEEIITVKNDDKEETIEKPCLLDVEWEFIEGNAASKPVQNYIKELVVNNNGKETDKTVTIAICFNDSQQSLASAMYLPKTVYDHCNQVLVYQRSIFDVANDVAIGDSDWRRYQHLFPFGMSEASYTENPFDSHLAALDYYMYENEKRFEQVKNYFDETKEYAYEQNKHEFEASILKSVDDAWENAGIVRKTASIDSVDSIPFKLRSMGIEYCRDLEKIKKRINKKKYRKIKHGLVEAEHNRWMMQMLISGFSPFSLKGQKGSSQKDLSPQEQKNIEQYIFDNEKQIPDLEADQLELCKKDNLSESEKSDLNEINKKLEEYKNKRDKLLNNGLCHIRRIEASLERKDLSICSFKRMEEVHKEGKEKDKLVLKMIPYLLRGNELLNVLMLRDTDGRYKKTRHIKMMKTFLYYDVKNGRRNAFLYLKRNKVEDEKKYCKHGFWMADTAVTREQWHYVTGKKPDGYDGNEEKPVVLVSKNDVEDFLDILRKKSGLYFDLPSLKEWETAATPEKNNKYKWTVNEGFVYSTKDNRRTGPEKVSKDLKSDTNKERLLHHMFGNVWEWTHKMDEHGLFKFAGGSWRFTEKECKINDNNNYWWHSWDADSKSDDLGFRLVWKYDRNVLTLNGNENMECDSKNSSNSSEVDATDVDGIKEWFKRKNHDFVKVDEGYFVMGAEEDPNNNPSNKPDDNEGPRHSVRISKPFYMCKVPVTQSLWNAVMGVKKPRLNPTTNRIGDEIPQTDISWEMIVDLKNPKNGFIDKLNEELDSISVDFQEDVKKCIETGYKFRLPTEAEWEYAAKSGMSIVKNINEESFMKEDKKTYYTINVEKDKDGKLKTDDNELYMRHKDKAREYPIYAKSHFSDRVKELAWFKQPSIHEVAEKLPNALGLYDMSGNVWEWCYDYYIAEMYDKCKLGNDKNIQEKKYYDKDEYKKKGYITNPVALDDSYSAHVFRGGSWRSSEWDCRCTRANYWGENYKSDDLGFRLVLGPPIGDNDAKKE